MEKRKISKAALAGLMYWWSENGDRDLFKAFKGPRMPKDKVEDAMGGDEDYEFLCGTGETGVYAEVATGVVFLDSGQTLDLAAYDLLMAGYELEVSELPKAGKRVRESRRYAPRKS